METRARSAPKGTSPAERLRILILEDDPDDAELIQRELARLPLNASVRWTSTRAAFIKALEDFSPQLVLSNYTLSGFDGLAALELIKARAPDTPFILISGTIGEEKAVEIVKRGAADYVLKDHIGRLEIALTRALRERREREDRLKAEAALRESRAQLQQSQKMEALGRLSGGVAHDFNNILTAITGYSELVLANPKLDAELSADIREILNAAFRAAALTRQLLAFSRRQIFAPKILDLNRTLADLDRMLQRIIGEDIKLTLVPEPSLFRVRADADQLGQVILNLVVNARDAMPKGGSLILRTANVELGEEAARSRPDVRPGRFVRLSVEDTGVGMDAGTLAHLYEPFFTTKTKGTGLGLATVYGIVKQSRGFVEAASRPGAGSVFLVYLPAAEGELEGAGEVAPTGSLRGTETILLVDDDSGVRLVARRMLESHGYAVVEARSGDEALRRCADPVKPIHLVLTDVVMAEMGGPELARRIKAARPECKVIFVSGYAESGLAESSADTGQFFSKPFTTEALLKKVRQALDAPPR